MLSLHEPPIITIKEVTQIEFYQDFIAFLVWLKRTPINRTKIGNISLSSIKPLLSDLKTTRKTISLYQQYGWNVTTEDNLIELSQIRLLAEIMHLTYNRKNKIYISRSGNSFLENLTPLEQYTQMMLHYWFRLNWDYFSHTTTVKGMPLAELLQQVQRHFWKFFLQKGPHWIDFVQFSKVTSDYFYLQPYMWHSHKVSDQIKYMDIAETLFIRNLLVFGCVETISKTPKKYTGEPQKIIKFRPTQVGLYLFYKALYENNLE